MHSPCPASMFTYRHSGLVVTSQMELPEWDAFACDGASVPDVRITLDEAAPVPRGSEPALVVEGNAARFTIEGAGSWQVAGGDAITLQPEIGADPHELRLFTLGSAWGLLGYQRGFAMWHGSAVSIGRKTALLCGDTGAGKSTMAAAMLAEGGVLVADDLSRVEPRGSGAVLYPSSARIKLWGPAVDHLGWRENVLHRDWMRDDKFHCGAQMNRAGEGPVPLDLIVVLETGEDYAVIPMSGAEAVKAVLQGTIYRPEALEAMGRWSEQGVLASQIVAGCAAVRLTRPRDLAGLGRSAMLLSNYLGSLG